MNPINFIKKSNNILQFQDCYGCGVCAIACPHNIISVKLNKKGFYTPVIEHIESCTECGMCLRVCAYNTPFIIDIGTKQYDAYAVWSKDKNIRKQCSSGGVGFEIGKYLLGQGYKVLAVKYDIVKQRAEHYIASNIRELLASVGSKYIQSYTYDGFKYLNRREKFLVTGTPCQIDSIRRYIKHYKIENNFVLVDFFCHGVPSKLLWDLYIEPIEKKFDKVSYVSWRNKKTGWHDSWSIIVDKNNLSDWLENYDRMLNERSDYYFSRLSEGDKFYRMFLSNMCLNKPCYTHCKYKMDQSAADIRIGDMWGATYATDQQGVSAVLVMTDKGKAVIEALRTDCSIIKYDASVVMEGQMKESPHKPWVYNMCMRYLQQGRLHMAFQWLKIYRIFCIPTRLYHKLIKLMHHES